MNVVEKNITKQKKYRRLEKLSGIVTSIVSDRDKANFKQCF